MVRKGCGIMLSTLTTYILLDEDSGKVFDEGDEVKVECGKSVIVGSISSISDGEITLELGCLATIDLRVSDIDNISNL